jgi:hypothetical protein
MSYFPSGFWSRLITRILSDDAIVDIVRAFFIMPKEVSYVIFGNFYPNGNIEDSIILSWFVTIGHYWFCKTFCCMQVL